MNIFAIAAGGAIGALLRFGLSGAVTRLTDAALPWGTIIVNLTGSFAIGCLGAFFDRVLVHANYKTFLLVGLIGSFTTFSTYMLDSLRFIQDGQTGLALANLLISNALGLLLVFAGFMSFRLILGTAS